MPISIKTMLFVVALAVTVGYTSGNSFAQSTGPAAFAAKQRVKNQVLAALADKKISDSERSDILEGAKDILNPQEYAGLVRTMDRLSPQESAVHLNSQNVNAMHKSISSPSVIKNLTSQVAYVERPRINELPKPSKILPKPGYFEPPQLDNTEVDKLLAKLPRLKDIYFEAPTMSFAVDKPAKQNKPTSSMASTVQSKSHNATQEKSVKQTQKAIVQKPGKEIQNATVKKNVKENENASAEDQVRQKKNAESLKKPSLTSNKTPIQQPARLWNDAERPSVTHPYADYGIPVLNTHAGALVSNSQSDLIKVNFDQPIAPEPPVNLH